MVGMVVDNVGKIDIVDNVVATRTEVADSVGLCTV